MTAIFGAAGIDQQVADWRSSSTDPSLAPGVVADIGSWLLRSNGLVQGEIFEKLAAADTEWGRNNLTLKVFNVKNFGAVGNGVTNDTTAIQSAINAAVAVGGGTIYFPPAPLGYAVVKVASNSTFLIENKSNLNFVGDGLVSLIKMTGSAGGGDWRCFTIRNFSTRINFYNIAIDASAVTNPDPADQLHFIQFQGLGAQPANSGATDCEVVGCFFLNTVGDGVRTGAEATKEVSNIRVRWNVFDMANTSTGAGARSCVGMQRFSNEMDIAYNFLTGVDDQEIDYEPTGGGGNRNDVVIGNIAVHDNKQTASITIGGAAAATPMLNTLLAYNIIDQGGYILPSSISGLVLEGNIVESTDDGSSNPVIYIRSLVHQAIFAGNVFYANNPLVSKVPIVIASDADGDTNDAIFIDNIVRSVFGNACIIGDTCNRTMIIGNKFRLTPDVAGTAVTVGLRGGAHAGDELDQCVIGGNIAINDSAGLACYRFATGLAGTKNTMFVGNHGVNAGATGFRWERSTTELFTGWRYCGENTMIGGSSSSFDLPASNVGVAFAGSAGLGVQQAAITLIAGPDGQVSAPPGSLCTNYLGGNAKTLFWKETGSGSTEWFGMGGWDYTWGCLDSVAGTITALFMAPGDSLATATATELKVSLARNCRIRNLRIVQVAGVGGGTITYTARINGVDTVVAATIAANATTGSNLVNSRACSAGDQLSIKITKSIAPATAPTLVRVILEII